MDNNNKSVQLTTYNAGQNNSVTVRDALKSDSKPLAVIRKENPVQATLIVEGFIVSAMGLVRAGKRISENEIPAVASLLLEDFYYFKPEDFQVCFKNGIKGLYGPTFDVLDATTFISWCSKYSDERATEAQKMKRNAYKTEAANEISDIATSEPIKRILESLPEIGRKIEPEPDRVELSSFEKIVQKQYGRLKIKSGFRIYRGKPVDFAEFFQRKSERVNNFLQKYLQD